jgi:hypothetical protein
MDVWGTLDLTTAIVRDDLNSSFRRSKKIVSNESIRKFPPKFV